MAVVFGLHLAASDRMSFFLTIKYNRLHENLDEGFFVHCLLASIRKARKKKKKNSPFPMAFLGISSTTLTSTGIL